MPSFDVVSEVDLHQFTNAVDQASRVVETRFDFKGIDASYARDKLTCTITAQADFQIDQMVDILRGTLIKSKIDPLAMEVGDLQATGKLVKKEVTVKDGLEIELAKKIVKLIKEGKTKVQTAIQDEQVRVTGKKRDDLQEVMAMLREAKLDQPLQFTNFRD
ncbi:MAG: YajQ family cyclic di-GMP-binding protein [Verrucomicrobiaceae bacterium]|nr:YajQ family cyclic di-GMP-binding protein [Verrucomicrobiaceae bacterium]